MDPYGISTVETLWSSIPKELKVILWDNAGSLEPVEGYISGPSLKGYLLYYCANNNPSQLDRDAYADDNLSVLEVYSADGKAARSRHMTATMVMRIVSNSVCGHHTNLQQQKQPHDEHVETHENITIYDFASYALHPKLDILS